MLGSSNYVLWFGEVGSDFNVSPRISVLHFVRDYTMLGSSNYALRFGEVGLMNDNFWRRGIPVR